MLSLPFEPLGRFAVLMVVIFILGSPLEWPAVMFMFLPVFVPVVIALDVDFTLVCVGTLVAVTLQTAFLSPPVAMAAYCLRPVAPDWSLADIYRGMAAFMGLQRIGLLFVFVFPVTAIWLPGVLFDR